MRHVKVLFCMPHRSLCTLVCKWTYCPPDGWDDIFWTTIGLEDLMENNYSKIGQRNKIFYYCASSLDV